jgi:hypothetical protein
MSYESALRSNKEYNKEFQVDYVSRQRLVDRDILTERQAMSLTDGEVAFLARCLAASEGVIDFDAWFEEACHALKTINERREKGLAPLD